jgi:Na+/pantothenate symporter
MEVVVAPFVVQQTKPLHQIIWLNVLAMGTIEQPFVQRNILVITTQPIVEVALACTYYQQVGHEFKNFSYPFCG